MPYTDSPTQSRNFLQRCLCVLKAMVQEPTVVATVMPSSRYLIEVVANRDCIRNAATVVELGPGEGETTRALLSKMRRDSRLLTIEVVKQFAGPLSSIDDPRLVVEIDSAARLKELMASHALAPADVIVSGIPFSSIPPETGKAIMQSIDQMLKPNGQFIAYQMRSDIEQMAFPYWGSPAITKVAFNIPPLKVYTWTKAGTFSEGDC